MNHFQTGMAIANAMIIGRKDSNVKSFISATVFAEAGRIRKKAKRLDQINTRNLIPALPMIPR